MKQILKSLVDAHRSGRPCILTQLVETRGSTPQKAGAAMLVFEDGSQVGTLGGGCVEAEVKQKALASLSTGQLRVETFQLNHDFGWDDGLICGGRMTTLIVPILPRHDVSYYETYLGLLEAKLGCTEAIEFGEATEPAVLRFLFADDMVTSAQADGPRNDVAANLKRLESRPRPYVAGGVSYLPHLPTARLIIVGAGHVGRMVARYASDVEFEVTVIDDREEYCNCVNIPEAARCLTGDFDQILPSLEIDDQAFCIVVTRGHNHDEEALFHLIQKSPRYLGMIGSKRKIRLIFDDLIRQGVSEMQLAKVHAPIGLEIGSQTVNEIAISIVAELIQSRNCCD